MSLPFRLLAYAITYPLRLVTPLMFAVLVAFLSESAISLQATFLHSPARILLFLYALLDIAFFTRFQRQLVVAQKKQPPPPITTERRETVWRTIRDSCDLAFLDAWFHPLPLKDLCKQHMESWIAWAVFDREMTDLDAEQNVMLQRMLAEVEEKRGFQFQDSKGSAQLTKPPRFMRLNIDPVYAQHRPLVYYLATALMDGMSDVVLYLVGFRRDSVGPLSFWIRKGKKQEKKQEQEAGGLNNNNNNNNNNNSRRPVLFVHGVGMGLATYLPFLRALYNSQVGNTSTLVLVELPHVSMKLGVDDIPSMQTFVVCVEEAMSRHGLKQALFVGHSLGTFAVAATNRLKPHLVGGIVLIDPVCFMLWEADLVHNFCYRPPTTPMQLIQHYHISRELSISHYFHRHFWWHECVLFAEELPKQDTVVFVSRLDDIYEPGRTLDYLASHKVTTHEFSDCGHGGWLFDSECTGRILKAIEEGACVSASNSRKS